MNLRGHIRALVFIASNSAIVLAQVRGSVQGRVLDPSGASIPNARIELTEATTSIQRQTTSSASGDYSFTDLNPGEYRVSVSAANFAKLARTGVIISVGQTTGLDLTLRVGADQEAITVRAAQPPLQSQTSNIQTNIPGATVVAIPLNSRNFVQLATLAPGVELPPGTLLPRINGGRPRTNEYLYDGISSLQPEPGQVAFFPALDNIQEFTVETNNVPAEFGRFNGGVVNLATRSGTNEIHGSIYEFFRNEALNARNYFSTTGSKPEYRRNLYGATLGAPIVKNRLFFF